MSALKEQVGGNHYSKLKIQPMQYSMANGLDACQHTVIKYVTRFRDKGGIEDLKKARHVLDMLIELEMSGLQLDLDLSVEATREHMPAATQPTEPKVESKPKVQVTITPKSKKQKRTYKRRRPALSESDKVAVADMMDRGIKPRALEEAFKCSDQSLYRAYEEVRGFKFSERRAHPKPEERLEPSTCAHNNLRMDGKTLVCDSCGTTV